MNSSFQKITKTRYLPTQAPFVRLLEDCHVRLAAVVALGDLEASSYAEQLGALKSDPDQHVRRSVGRSQGVTGNEVVPG